MSLLIMLNVLVFNLSLAPNTALAEVTEQNASERSGLYDPADPEYRANLTKFSYILYYGAFNDEIASSILSTKPTLLITNYYAMNSDIRSEFAKNNVSVIAYVPIQWTQRDLGSALTEVNQLLYDGADGIFVDEASTISNDWELWYHSQLYDAVKSVDEEKIVVINPGTASLSEDAMLVADIICFEHEWRNIKNVEWMSKYPGWRYMGISSNEFVNVMGYHVNAETAKQDLDEARSLNIAYQYSADHYIWLPPWFDVYGGYPNSLHPLSPYIQLNLDSQVRPDSYYPVVDTTDREAGNDHDVVIIDEGDNRTSVHPDHDTNVDNATSSPTEQPEEDTTPEQPEEQEVDKNDNSTDSNSVTDQSNMTENLDGTTDQQIIIEPYSNMTDTSNRSRLAAETPPIA